MKAFEPGQVLGERYQLVRVIAVGTFGDVWHGEHLALRSPVAVKVLNPLSLKGEARQRFLTEALSAAALRSPHVVQILDCGVEGQTPYIVMELLEGESLAERLDRVSRLDVAETARVVRHVARAIDRAQEAGIVHRDLKPGNVFIQANDGDEIVKVLDFGIARTSPLFLGARALQSAQAWSETSLNLTPPGIILGTPNYMSPEQASGAVDVDVRTDIWSLGIIAYECLVGRPPHDGGTVHEVLANVLSGTPVIPSQHADVPAGFDAWFARACAHSVLARYESGKQAADEFFALCGLPPSPSATAETAPLAAPWPLISRSEPVGDPTDRLSPESNVPREAQRGELRASRVPRALPLPTGRARIAWAAAALAVGSLGAWWLYLAGRVDEVTAMPLPRSPVATASAHLEPSSSAAPRSVRQVSEPLVAKRLAPSESQPLGAERSTPSNNEPLVGVGSTPSENASLGAERSTPSKPAAPPPMVAASSADGTAATVEGEPARTTAAASTSAKRPTSSTTQTPRRRTKKTNAQLARDCRQPWFFDDQGLPRAKLECL